MKISNISLFARINIAVTILFFLMGIFYPVYNKLMHRFRENHGRNILTRIKNSEITYFKDHGHYVRIDPGESWSRLATLKLDDVKYFDYWVNDVSLAGFKVHALVKHKVVKKRLLPPGLHLILDYNENKERIIRKTF